MGNNYFKVTRTNTQESKIITIPDGEYNLTELKDKINQVIDTHTGFEGLTFDILNHKIRFYVDNNTEEYILYFAVNNDGSFDKFIMLFEMPLSSEPNMIAKDFVKSNS